APGNATPRSTVTCTQNWAPPPEPTDPAPWPGGHTGPRGRTVGGVRAKSVCPYCGMASTASLFAPPRGRVLTRRLPGMPVPRFPLSLVALSLVLSVCAPGDTSESAEDRARQEQDSPRPGPAEYALP